jgi:elongation of very long chain fatty acids protein 4
MHVEVWQLYCTYLWDGGVARHQCHILSKAKYHIHPTTSASDIMAPKTDTISSSETLVEGADKKVIKKDEDESIFSLALLPPILLVGAYLYFLRYLTDQLEAVNDPEQFKSIWWSGPISFSIIYLVSIKIGVEYMKTREPFKIKPYIFTYNLYQCLLNAWSVYTMVQEVRTNPWFHGMWGNTPQAGAAGFRISFLVWVHYNNKYIELLDTLWMILRKKNNQISFLHCYHHILLIWAWFFCIKIESGGDCYFGATVNSGIHVIMYGYYTMALLNIPCPWKKWITNCQMVQFAACLTHSIYVVVNGNMPIALPLAQGFVMVNMLVLFGRFYVKSYMTKKDPKAKKLE